MSEWWTYRLSDFLLFSPRTYYRMIEHYNEAVWPMQLLTVALGGIVSWALLRPRGRRTRMAWLILALLWAWTGWAFVGRRYAAINWAAVYVLPLFAIQMLVLLRAAWIARGGEVRESRAVPQRVGLALLVAAIALYPGIAILAGRDWRQAEVFGLAPDPTAIGTLGAALLAPGGALRSLMIVPVVWCVLGGLTLWAMESPEAWVPPLASLLAIGAGGKLKRS